MLVFFTFIMSHAVSASAAQAGAVRNAPVATQNAPTTNMTSPMVGESLQIGSRVVKLNVPQILVTLPAGGEELNQGTSHQITWSNKSSDNTIKVNIALVQGDTVHRLLASGIPISQGKYAWTIAADIVQGQYSIYIASATDGKYFGSSDLFSIIKPEINILPMSGNNYWLLSDVPPAAVFGQNNDFIPFAWTYKGFSVPITITWHSTLGDGQQFVIASGIPIGTGGKGSYKLSRLAGKSLFQDYIRKQPKKQMVGYVKIVVQGTNFSSKSNDFTITWVGK